MKCQCGGTFQRGAGRFDFSCFAGIESSLIGVPLLRCTKCKGRSLEGQHIKIGLCLVSQEIVRHPEYLNGVRLKYLRKSIGLSQGQLAKSLQVTSRLIADLESNKILLRNRETKSRIHKIVVDCNRLPWSLSATQIAQMRTSATAHAWAMLRETTDHAILR